MQRFRATSGASAVEFAIILLPMLLIVLGIVEFSFAFSRSQAMDSSSREGARLASIGADAQTVGQRASEALATTFIDPNHVSGTIERLDTSGAPTGLAWTLALSRSGSAPAFGYGASASGPAEAPCNGVNSAASVRVRLFVEPDRTDDYAINLRVVPVNVNQDFKTEAVFRCEP